MLEKRTKCAFSVKYYRPDYIDEIWAADWDYWKTRRQWSRSWRSVDDRICWHPEPGLDGWAYMAILEKFGLKDWKGEYPLERIIFMSPLQLARERRKKESKNNLPRLEIISDTLGDPRPAEEYP
jgi:hypothetical protein